MPPGRRRPRWVFEGGEEPDPRFCLANERTFLAWLRTSLALQASGVGISGLDLGLEAVCARASGALFLSAGILAAMLALASWQRTEWALRHGRALPSTSGKLVITALVLAAGMVGGVGALW